MTLISLNHSSGQREVLKVVQRSLVAGGFVRRALRLARLGHGDVSFVTRSASLLLPILLLLFCVSVLLLARKVDRRVAPPVTLLIVIHFPAVTSAHLPMDWSRLKAKR